ncbi:MAG: D-alanyl-D-alanine carboxypeptidase [Alphaproteobacteria bacterium]
MPFGLNHLTWRTSIALIIAALLVFGVGIDRAVAGYAAIVVDQDTGEVLHESHADDLNYPASLTKMMTLYMAFTAIKNGRLRLDTPLKVSKNAATQPPSNLKLKAGSTIKTKDAILALVTKSANDVAVVMAEALGGSEERFAEAMTKRARQLGMKDTAFRNASGLPEAEQLTSARDMARLAIALRRDFPSYYKYFSTTSFTYKGQTYSNHNKLLASYKGADGIKTGYTHSSGFNLVATAERGGRRLVAVVLGGDTGRQRDTQVKKLLNSGFGLGPKPRDLKVAKRPLLKPTPAQIASSRNRALAAKALELTPPPSRQEVLAGKLDLSPEPSLDDVLASSLELAPPPSRGGATVATAAREGNKPPYGIQVGAYDTKAAAEKALKRAEKKVGAIVKGTDTEIDPIKAKKGKTLYRAKFSGLSKKEAADACKKLSKTKLPCMVIKLPAEALTVASVSE